MESMEIYIPQQIGHFTLISTLICLLCSCDDGDGSVAVGDPPDGGLPECNQPLADAHGISILRCPDGTRLGIRFENGVSLDGVGPALEMDGQLHPPTDWPEALWRTTGDTVEGQFPATATLPAMTYRVSLRPAQLDLTVELPPGDDVTFDAVDVIYAKGGGMGVQLDETPPDAWRTFAAEGGPFPAPRSGVERASEQLIYATGAALHIGSAKPGLGLSIALDPDARRDAVGLRATLRTPIRVVAPNAFSVSVELRAGPDGGPLLAAYAAGRNAPERRQKAGWGWRSGPRFGDRADLVLMSTHASALVANDLPAPHLILDGRWYETLGTWRPNAGFPGGFPELAEVISPARFGIRWPLLHTEPSSGVATAHPDWMIDGLCEGVPCPLVDPALPAVQETLRGEANRLFDQGVALVIVSGLEAVADPRRRQRVPDILPTYSQAGLEGLPNVALGSPHDSSPDPKP